MANLTASVRDYCTLLTKSRLLPGDEVEAIHRRWQGESLGTDDQVSAFRKYLVAKKHLTEYQAVMLLRGHADGFFLNGYKILDRIGKGQMGGVYKAVHTLGQTVALKILSGSKARDPHVMGRFLREARLLTQVDHPNVVRAFQLGDADGVHYIVMEILDGETLDQVLARRKKLPTGEAVRIAHQTLAGLQHLHDRRMVHRDLKPANLMLVGGSDASTWDATIKIVDIGLGRELFDESDADEQLPTQLTVEGAVLGTPDYLAPEQAKDARTADHRADLYSLGCVLYHALTGHPPFPETNIMAQMLRHATESPPTVAGIPSGLQAVLDRLLAKKPDDRYASAAAAAGALAAFLTPNAGAAPNAARMVPAFQQWLETESQMEMPKPGTAPAPALPKPAAVAGVSDPGYRPPRPRPVADEVDVELVPALPQVVQLPAPPPVLVYRDPPPRAMWELDRRDMMMLGVGGLGVFVAVGLGYGLARLARRKPDPETTD